MQGHKKSSYPRVPSLDKAIAALLLPRSSGWSVYRWLMPPLQRDRKMLGYFDKISKYIQNVGPFADPSQNDFVDHSIGQMCNLIQGVTTSVGRIMVLGLLQWAPIILGWVLQQFPNLTVIISWEFLSQCRGSLDRFHWLSST